MSIDEKINDINKYCDDIENGEYENKPPGNAEENKSDGNEGEQEEEQEEEYDDTGGLSASLEIKATATPITLIS